MKWEVIILLFEFVLGETAGGSLVLAVFVYQGWSTDLVQLTSICRANPLYTGLF